MDKLTNLFAYQKKFQEQLGYFFEDMDTERRVAYIKEYTLHCEHELHEMLQELPFFKPWKEYRTLTKREVHDYMDKAAEEYVDALHFFLNVGIALGYTSESLWDAYCDKHDINYQRQEQSKYKKCVEDDE